MPKIQVYQGKFDETCTVSSNLTQNAQKKPIIREVIEYAEPRMLSTLICSGAKGPWDLQVGSTPADGALRTKIGEIPKDKLIGDNAYRYNIMPRIQRASVINGQVGVSGPNGTFTLSMADNQLYDGMNVRFWSPAIGLCRVMGPPTGGPGAYIYNFQSVDQTPFVFATHVAPQPGQKTCFGAHSTYSERSLRGYGRSFFPDQFINHLTIQRKTVALSGSALTDVIWYELASMKGWRYVKEQENSIIFMMEDEDSKWFGQSTMRDSLGNLLSVSNLTDPVTGEPIVAGDGVEQQILGGNVTFGSGPNGEMTASDFQDMMIRLEKKSKGVYGRMWYVVTGTDGYANAQNVLRDYHVNLMGGRQTSAGNNTKIVGGEDIPVGGNFDTFNFAGNQLVFVKNTMQDDEQRWSNNVNSAGKLKKSSQYYFLDMSKGSSGQSNIEILGKGAYGINRSLVTAYLNGLTGYEDKVISSTDALEYNMLKENGIFIYNTQSCGIAYGA